MIKANNTRSRSSSTGGAGPALHSIALVDTADTAKADLPCWCRSGRWSVCVKGRRFSVLQCSGCKGYRIDPPCIDSPEESEEFYTEYYRTRGHEVLPSRTQSGSREAGFWRVAEKFAPLYQVGKSAVDIGCGDGHLCAQLKAHGWPSVAGIDVSKTRVARARRVYPELTFFDQALPATGLKKQSLDLIVMEALIEHLPRPLETLQGLREFLSPGGRIVLTTPNMDSGEFRFLGKRWTPMLAPHAHIFLFSPASLRRLLSDAGFAPDLTGNFHTPLYTPIDYLKRLGRGDLKGTIWRAHQDLGAMYGRLIGSGSMLFAVGRNPQ